METMYDRIKKQRMLKKMSQEQLARKTGYTDRSSIAKIESGKVDLTQSKIAAFASALGVTIDYLLGPVSYSSPICTANTALSPEQIELITAYRASDAVGRQAAMMVLLANKKDDLPSSKEA